MTTILPLAIRPKDDGELIWLSKEENLGGGKRAELFLKERAVSCGPYFTARDDSTMFVWSEDRRRKVDYLICENAFELQIFPALVRHGIEAVAPAAPASSSEFSASEELLRKVLSSQADGEKRDALRISELKALKVEVSERIVASIADIGFRWQQREKGAGRVASFGAVGVLEWCDEELSKLLLYELNISIVSAARIFDVLFSELRDALRYWRCQGDWGKLVSDGDVLTLIPVK